MPADWFGTVATAVVGATGIIATLWVTISSQRAQERQALTDEKRRAYSAIFVQADRVVGALKRVTWRRAHAESAGSAGDLIDALAELEDSRLALNSAVYDLMLVAPAAVTEGALDLYLLCLAAVDQTHTGDNDAYRPAVFTAARRKLLNLMRADLGRVPLSIRDTPSMVGATPSDRGDPASP